MEANSLLITRERHRPRRRAFVMVAFAVLLELTMLMPFIDHLADAHPMIHFTQHGFIFAGGVVMGLALRDVQRTYRR
ncbi:MAG TPA: hypothetical protein VMA77_28455 [Solirubrobacteraceae bacterium]|nr:hypothetical protein [Solirubrobacteraceae bacterium]